MTRLRGLICICGLAAALLASSASAASAATFYVSTTGKDTNACTEPALPCKTIAKAVTDSEGVPGAATVDVGAGTYEETVKLAKPADDGLTINGAGSAAGGTVLQPPSGAGEAAFHVAVPGAAISLSNLSIVDVSGNAHDGVETVSETTLENVAVDMRNPDSENGIVASEFGSLVLDGCAVTMESGSTGVAIGAGLVPLTVENTSVTVENGSKSIGVEAEDAPVSIAAATLNLGSTAGVGIEATGGSTSLSGVSVTDGGEQPGLESVLAKPVSMTGVHLTMTNAKNTNPGVVAEYNTSETIQGLHVSGAWGGPALVSVFGNVTLRDSQLIEAPTSTAMAVEYEGESEGPGLFVQRSVLETSPTAGEALLALGGSVTLDSSEVLGGKDGILFDQVAGKERTLTVSASTVDAGTLGEAGEAGVAGVDVIAGEDNSIANARIVGSVVLEPQIATVEAGGKSATIDCSYSDAPNQTQTATATEGTIACPTGSSGETSSEVKSLFSEPFTNYQLSPSSSALVSVPAGAISLPFGLTPSSTDLAGNPRSENVACAALQDKGALELPGHGTPCPTPAPPASPLPAPKPLAGVISALTISPSALFAAPSGATISAITSSAKKYGAKISYRDSQAATTTFTVLRETSGRKQGKSCKKPSNSNKHGKRCTLYVQVGSFTHADKAAANSFHFSGRLKGRRLAPGSYRLQAVAHDAAGNGVAVDKSFTIR
jgi:hypothetical protein